MSKVSGHFKIATATPTISASAAYAANDQVGGIQTLTLPDDCAQRLYTLLSLRVVDAAAQSAGLQFLFFNSLPTVASSDNAALNISDTEMLKFVGAATITSSHYVTTSANSAASLPIASTGIVMQPAQTSTALYVVVKTTGTPTYGSTSDLKFTYVFGVDQ